MPKNSGAAYASVVLGDTPTGYWRLGESSGTTASDASGNGLAATYNGGFTLGAGGALSGSEARHPTGMAEVAPIASGPDYAADVRAAPAPKAEPKERRGPGVRPGKAGRGDILPAPPRP